MPGERSPIFPERAELPSCTLSPLDPETAANAGRVLIWMDPWRTLGYSEEALRGYLSFAGPGLYRYAIGSEGAPAGVFCLRHPWLMGPFIELLAVFARFQGKGIGREIVEWARSSAPAANVWSSVSSFNAKARRFYASAGFTEVAVLDGLVKSGYDEILLRMRV